MIEYEGLEEREEQKRVLQERMVQLQENEFREFEKMRQKSRLEWV